MLPKPSGTAMAASAKTGKEKGAKPGSRWAYGSEKAYGSAKYHGMRVGGEHRWTYPDGQWTERKVRPDRWDIRYTSLKRRNKKAPGSSGAEVRSGYHWFITAHQWVEKLDANTYATHLEGSKYLVAFRKPDWPVWNTQFRNAKRHAKERTIAALQDAVRRIESGDLDLEEPQQKDALAALAAHAAEIAYERETQAKTMVPAQAADGNGDGNGNGDDDGGEADGVTARPAPKRPSRAAAGRPKRKRRAKALAR